MQKCPLLIYLPGVTVSQTAKVTLWILFGGLENQHFFVVQVPKKSELYALNTLMSLFPLAMKATQKHAQEVAATFVRFILYHHSIYAAAAFVHRSNRILLSKDKETHERW